MGGILPGDKERKGGEKKTEVSLLHLKRRERKILVVLWRQGPRKKGKWVLAFSRGGKEKHVSFNAKTIMVIKRKKGRPAEKKGRRERPNQGTPEALSEMTVVANIQANA